jgi:hypothetical protein
MTGRFIMIDFNISNLYMTKYVKYIQFTLNIILKMDLRSLHYQFFKLINCVYHYSIVLKENK